MEENSGHKEFPGSDEDFYGGLFLLSGTRVATCFQKLIKPRKRIRKSIPSLSAAADKSDASPPFLLYP